MCACGRSRAQVLPTLPFWPPLSNLKITEEWPHWAVYREFPRLVFLEFSSLGLIRFPREYLPLSCMEGNSIAASLSEVLILIIQHAYDHVPPGLNYFLMKVPMPSSGQVIFQCKESLFYSLSLQEISSGIMPMWKRGLKDFPLNFHSVFLLVNLSPILDEVYHLYPSHWAFWVLSCVNQADFPLSHHWLKFGFFLFTRIVASHSSAF